MVFRVDVGLVIVVSLIGVCMLILVVDFVPRRFVRIVVMEVSVLGLLLVVLLSLLGVGYVWWCIDFDCYYDYIFLVV